MKIRKASAPAAVLATALWALAPGMASANGVGDLYAATSSGVLELHVASTSVINTIPMVPAPQTLVFSPDGLTLLVGTGDARVVPIDVVSLQVQSSIMLPAAPSALAFPAGQLLVAAMPSRRSLAFVVIHGGTVTESATLPGPGNLLAGDRREARVAVAQQGSSWLAVVDPATSTVKRATVSGGIAALAIDRDRGGVLVATTAPNALLWVDLTSLATSWSVTLPAAPTAVASWAGDPIVAGGSTLWSVDGKKAATFATAKESVVALAASDEGAYLHVAEASSIEVFDSKGTLARTLALAGMRSPVALAPVPKGSSLFLGQGSGSPAPSSSPHIPQAASLSTAGAPTTSTIVNAVSDLANSPPLQGAAAVAGGILFLCWLFIRWYDRRVALRRAYDDDYYDYDD